MLEPFKNFLSSKGRMQSKYIPFYLRWVADCYRFLDIALSQCITNEQKSQFLKHLSKSHEDWQVNQADNALRLYSYFLSRPSTDENVHLSATEIDDWKSIEKKTIEAIRLRHRSYSTEKTYLTRKLIISLMKCQGFNVLWQCLFMDVGSGFRNV